MNLAIFASAFHPHVGGVEELVRQLAHAYRADGHAVVVFSNRWPRDLPQYEVFEDIPVIRPAFRSPEGSLKARVSFTGTQRRIQSEVNAGLREHQVDLIHVQCVSTNGFYADRAANELGLPLVVTSQGERTMDASRVYERSRFLNATLRSLLARADYVTACSQATLDDLETYCGTELGHRGAVVYNGISLRDFDGPLGATPHPRPYVLGIGRLVPQKGFDVLIRAFARAAADAAFPYDLVLAGEGSEAPLLTRLVGELGLEGRVRMFGRADRKQAIDLFRHAQVFTLSSRREPFGIVNLEAMAAGTPIVATAVGGVPEFVHDGENGLLVPPDDLDAMAEALVRLATDSALRSQLAENGRREVQRFDWKSIAAQYEQIYDVVRHPRAGDRVPAS